MDKKDLSSSTLLTSREHKVYIMRIMIICSVDKFRPKSESVSFFLVFSSNGCKVTAWQSWSQCFTKHNFAAVWATEMYCTFFKTLNHIYSAVRMKPNKKYLKFSWVFTWITRVMRSLSIKNYCRNASKNEKITIFEVLGVFWGIFQKFWFWKILNFDMDQYFRMKLSA